MSDESTGWGRHSAEQRRAWLRLTYAERLAWLEQAKRFCTLALGAARDPSSHASTARDDDGAPRNDGRRFSLPKD